MLVVEIGASPKKSPTHGHGTTFELFGNSLVEGGNAGSCHMCLQLPYIFVSIVDCFCIPCIHSDEANRSIWAQIWCIEPQNDHLEGELGGLFGLSPIPPFF